MADNSMSNSDILRQQKESFSDVRMPLPTGNGLDTEELPFIVAVLDDFRGNSEKALAKRGDLVDRTFEKVTADTLDDKMSELSPGLEYDVKCTLPNTSEKTIRVSLGFSKLKDLGPKRVAEQIPQVAALIKLKEQLEVLKSRESARPEARKALEAFVAQLMGQPNPK